jgi:hypothetical protein
MTKKAIRVDCEKKIFYFIEIEISTYDKEIEAIKQELNTDSLIINYLPGCEAPVLKPGESKEYKVKISFIDKL